MFQFTQIEFGYAGHKLLHNTSVTLNPGQLTLLRGANGAGKTTLLKIIAGLLTPASCQVRLDQHSGQWKTLRQIIRKTSCYLHQSPYMFNGTVLHNLRIIATKKSHEQLMQALELVGIAHLHEHQASTLSGGEKQRLAMARAYLHQPQILLLDEPLANMDSAMVERTLTLINHFKQNNSAVLLCSHMHDALNNIADQQLILENGKLQNNELPS